MPGGNAGISEIHGKIVYSRSTQFENSNAVVFPRLGDATVKEGGEVEDEKWSKNAKLFPSFCKVGIKKSITFAHEKHFLCSLDYV